MKSCSLGAVTLVALMLISLGAEAAPDQPSPVPDQAAPGQPPESAAEKPWEVGVSDSVRSDVNIRYAKGNEFFVGHKCPLAIPEYQAALDLWDHPAIRYNLAVCQIDVGAPPQEIHAHLVSALRYGQDPLGPEKFRDANRYLELVRGQLGRLTVQCEQAGANISLDGKPLFVAPKTQDVLVLPGTHQVVAEQEGYVTTTYSINVGARSEKSVDVMLSKPTALERRFPTWVPIATTATGAILIGAAIPFSVLSQRNADSYDDGVVTDCPTPICTDEDLSEKTLNHRSRANRYEKVAIAGYVVGGTAIVAGITLFVLNVARKPKSKYSAWMPVPTGQGVAWSF